MARRTLGKYAFGFCDKTGFRYPIHQLKEEFIQGRPTGLRVGPDVWDLDHPQNWLGVLDIQEDPQALDNPRIDLGEDESRRMFSFNPVGFGNMAMTSSVGRVTFVAAAANEELVSNGSFDSETSWTLGSNWQITGGAASLINISLGTTTGTLDQTPSTALKTNTVYVVTVVMTSYSQGGVAVSLMGVTGSTVSANGTSFFSITTPSSGTNILTIANVGDVFTEDIFDGEITSISVVEN